MTAREPGAPGPAATTAALPAPSRRGPPWRAGPRWWLLSVCAVILGAVVGVVIARVAAPAALTQRAALVLPGGYFSREQGQKAGPWQLPDLSRPSRVVSLAQFRGHPVVVNFWASWCPPCRKEMPALEHVARLLAGKVDFVGLDTQDQRGAGLAFARSMRATYPMATDNVQVYASYGVNGLPTTFFVSADGTIAGRQVGGMTEAALKAIVHEVFGIAVRQP